MPLESSYWQAMTLFVALSIGENMQSCGHRRRCSPLGFTFHAFNRENNLPSIHCKPPLARAKLNLPHDDIPSGRILCFTEVPA
jgi:hypothetical protein